MSWNTLDWSSYEALCLLWSQDQGVRWLRLAGNCRSSAAKPENHLLYGMVKIDLKFCWHWRREEYELLPVILKLSEWVRRWSHWKVERMDDMELYFDTRLPVTMSYQSYRIFDNWLKYSHEHYLYWHLPSILKILFVWSYWDLIYIKLIPGILLLGLLQYNQRPQRPKTQKNQPPTSEHQPNIPTYLIYPCSLSRAHSGGYY